MVKTVREVAWIKGAQKDFKKFPAKVRERMVDALTFAADGGKADIAKPLKGIGSGAFEIVVSFSTDAYRCIYAIKLGDIIWVVHAFKKKSKSGIKTPKQDIDLIKARIKWLKEKKL